MRRMTPAMRRQWVNALVLGVLAVLMLVDSYIDYDRWSWLTVAAAIVFMAGSARRAKLAWQSIYASEVAFIVRMGFGSQLAVRFSLIESFQWLSNLENLGGKGQRLWIVLTDGQKVPTPVIVGDALERRPEILLPPADARELVRSLEALCVHKPQT